MKNQPKPQTHGIETDIATKDRYNTTKTASKTELLDLKAGYVQHTSLFY